MKIETKVKFKYLDLSCHMTLMCYKQRFGPVTFDPLINLIKFKM